MKIMSFNTQHCLNYVERKIDYNIMAKAIINCGADVVGLNEMYNHPELFERCQTANLSSLTGLEHSYFAKAIDLDSGDDYGNGILSRYPILKAETIMIPDPVKKGSNDSYETRCILKVKLENGVTVLVTHFGLNEDEQKNAVMTVLENLEKEKCILMGDFNALPDDEVLKPIRERMKDTADAFKQTLLSFPSDNPDRKIDYIFTSEDIEIINADIPNIVASDHRPHTATVNI